MVQEAETPVIELELVSCGTCDTVFISSERRQTCPACGGEAVGPYLEFIVTPEGPRLKNGAVAIARAAAPPPAPPAEPEVPAADVESDKPMPGSTEEDRQFDQWFAEGARLFLSGEEATEDQLRENLLELGADPETATTTVGRLVAVRDTLNALHSAGAQAQEEAAAEEPPADAPEPAAGEAAGSPE